jgi:hypothetical protein
VSALNDDSFRLLIEAARYAPSVHNIQPTRWRRVGDQVLALQASGRALPVGDPTGRDLAASHGAAVEGLRLAASALGMHAAVEAGAGTTADGFAVVATVALAPSTVAIDPLAAFLTRRRTHRGAFGPTTAAARKALEDLGQTASDLSEIDDPSEIAKLNDWASLRTFRDGAFRAELLSWMRLRPAHPDWSRDGLNAEAMSMTPLEAFAAGIVLRPGVFEAADRIGLARAATSESEVVLSSAAVILFQRPQAEAPFETGRAWHRAWLSLTRLGLVAAPMTVLADDAEAPSSG